MYLAEPEELLPSLGQSDGDALVRDVFRATIGDAAKVRIVSLLEVPPLPPPNPAVRGYNFCVVATVPLLEFFTLD